MTAHHDDPRRPATAEEEHLSAYAAWLDRDEPPAWFRESVQREWKVGDRVIYRWNPECEPLVNADRQRAVDGQPATVIHVLDKVHDGHRFYVEFDDPALNVGAILGYRVAANEIESLTDTPATGAAGRGDGEGR